jgi:hypothetical protein
MATEDEIAAAEAALLNSQARSYRHGETSVENYSLEERIKLLNMLKAGVRTRTRSTVACYRSFR